MKTKKSDFNFFLPHFLNCKFLSKVLRKFPVVFTNMCEVFSKFSKPRSLYWKNWWNFFQMPLKYFLMILRTCSRCLKVLRNIALCVSKNFVAVLHINEANSMEMKNEAFFLWTKCYTFCTFLKNRALKVPGQLRYPFR